MLAAALAIDTRTPSRTPYVHPYLGTRTIHMTCVDLVDRSLGVRVLVVYE
eukprot:COSAG01_NODE_770_length_13726_cov_66.211639_11_plen_50_part_00